MQWQKVGSSFWLRCVRTRVGHDIEAFDAHVLVGCKENANGDPAMGQHSANTSPSHPR